MGVLSKSEVNDLISLLSLVKAFESDITLRLDDSWRTYTPMDDTIKALKDAK